MVKQAFIIRDEQIRHNAVKAILDLDLEKPWDITIKPYVKKRSLDQNSLMHMWEQQIADETGNSKNAVHQRMMEEFLSPYQKIVMGKMTEYYTTTKLSTAEMSNYLDNIHSFAAAWGIHLPLPEEMHRENR